MTETEEIVDLVREWAPRSTLTEHTTLEGDLGVYGDDLDELLEEYAERFHVDLSTYRWYFHTREEGWNLGGIFFRSPDRRVPRIPITVAMLRDFASAGVWSVDYPAHELPRRRYDLLTNRSCVVLFLVVALAVLLATLLV